MSPNKTVRPIPAPPSPQAQVGTPVWVSGTDGAGGMGSMSWVGSGSGGKGSENVADGLATGWENDVVCLTAEVGVSLGREESTVVACLATRLFTAVDGDGYWDGASRVLTKVPALELSSRKGK